MMNTLNQSEMFVQYKHYATANSPRVPLYHMERKEVWYMSVETLCSGNTSTTRTTGS